MEEKEWIKLNLYSSLETYSKDARIESEKLLKSAPIGSWLLRAANPEDVDVVVTISSKHSEGFKHHRVQLTKAGNKYWIAVEEEFSTVMDLIKYSRLLVYLTQPLIPIKTLKKPNPRQKEEEDTRTYDEEKAKLKPRKIEEERRYDEENASKLKPKKIEEGYTEDTSVPKKEISKSQGDGNMTSSKTNTPSKSSTKKVEKSTSKSSKNKKVLKKEVLQESTKISMNKENYVLLVMCADKNIKMNVEASSVDDIIEAIGKQCSLLSTFRVEYLDPEFNEYVELLELNSLNDKKGKVRVVIEQRSDWQFSSKFLEHKNWQIHGGDLTPYRSILLKDQSVVLDPSEFKKLEAILEKYEVPKNTNITKVYAFQNDALERAFIYYYQSLQEKFRSSPALFKKDGWMKEKFSQSRLWTYEQFKKKVSKFDWTKNPDVPILPVFHGTGKDTPWKIVQTGFTTIAQVDEGFFGRGIYFTTSFDYAIFYSKNINKGSKVAYILVSFVLPGNPYPVIESPLATPSFKGKGPADPSGYQSHYVCVNKSSGPSASFGFPCSPNTEHYYDELVIFQDYQAVPKYLLEVETNF